jgi:hypothetical protein
MNEILIAIGFVLTSVISFILGLSMDYIVRKLNLKEVNKKC